MKYTIRGVRTEDLESIAAVEAECFPPAEAADKQALEERIAGFPDSFFVAESEDGEVIGFINGCVTYAKTICDEMFEDISYHKPDGDYQSIFGLDVVKDWQRRGVAAALMGRMIEETRDRGKKGLILTCKEHLIPFYSNLGYRNLGLSESVHGDAVWYDMILEW